MFAAAGGAVGDIFGSLGDFAEAAGYSTAAKLAGQNAQYAAQSAAIQTLQTQRQAYQVIGGQASDVAGAGLRQSGTANAILRSSQQQASLQKQLVIEQGKINVNSWLSQQAADKAMSSAATFAGIGGLFSAAGSIVGGIIGGGS
jgi:hypothetical protein